MDEKENREKLPLGNYKPTPAERRYLSSGDIAGYLYAWIRGEFSQKRSDFSEAVRKLAPETRILLLETLLRGKETAERLSERTDFEEERNFIHFVFSESYAFRLLGLEDCGRKEKTAKLVREMRKRLRKKEKGDE